MDKKIIFLDLDGTLTNDEKKVTPLTQKALLEMQKAGHIVVLASGRPTPGILPVAKAVELEKFGGYIMAFNGGKIINAKTNEVVFEQVLDRKYISPLLKYAKEKIGKYVRMDSGIKIYIYYYMLFIVMKKIIHF